MPLNYNVPITNIVRGSDANQRIGHVIYMSYITFNARWIVATAGTISFRLIIYAKKCGGSSTVTDFTTGDDVTLANYDPSQIRDYTIFYDKTHTAVYPYRSFKTILLKVPIRKKIVYKAAAAAGFPTDITMNSLHFAIYNKNSGPIVNFRTHINCRYYDN